MNLKFALSTFAFLIVSLVIFYPSMTFANETIIIPSGTGIPGCEKTNSCYLPYAASVGIDQTVIWINEDSAAHTVTSGVSPNKGGNGPDGKFDSNLFMPGDTFSVIFGGEGTYNYFCIVHPWMTGVVIVDEHYGSQTTTNSPITIHADKSIYRDGDTIHVSGAVSDIIDSVFSITLSVIRPDNKIIAIQQFDVSTNKTFQTELTAGGSMWDTNGIYTIKVLYGTEASTAQTTIEFKKIEQDLVPPLLLVPDNILVDATDNQGARVEYSVKSIDDVDGVLEPFCNPPSGYLFPIGDNKVTCQSFDSSGNDIKKTFTITVQNPASFVIPNWVKEVAGFWCNDEIDDSSFIEAIQYLIENRVILVPIGESGSGISKTVPSWIKNNACWWSQGMISDDDFASGIEYLIQQGIIKV